MPDEWISVGLFFVKLMIRGRDSNWLQKGWVPELCDNSKLIFTIVFLLLLPANQEAGLKTQLSKSRSTRIGREQKQGEAVEDETQGKAAKAAHDLDGVRE